MSKPYVEPVLLKCLPYRGVMNIPSRFHITFTSHHRNSQY